MVSGGTSACSVEQLVCSVVVVLSTVDGSADRTGAGVPVGG
jgi:hypothetical protein